MGQTPPRVTFKQIQKDTLTGSIAVSGLDSNLTYSRNFYISADSFLILYGDTVGQGSLNAILVDGVTILGDGVNTNLSADTNLIKDIIGAMVNAGLGIDVSYDNVDKELLIESLSIEDLVYNGTGTQIDKGTPLYVVGVQGNYWSVAPADAGDIAKLPVVAIAGENIASGTEGLALIKGHIKGVNTSAFTAGDEVYVAVGGGYTNVKPKGESNYVQYLGTVIKADANGSGIINLGEVESNLNPGRIFIGAADSTITRVTLNDSISAILGDSLASNVVRSITAGTFLSGGTITTSGTIALDTASAGLKTYIGENIGTVDLASQVTGTLPVANGGTGATTLSGAGIVTGTGTTNYLPKFTGSTTIGNSLVYDNGTNVGINTTSPASLLQVGGTITSGANGVANGAFDIKRSSDGLSVATFDIDVINSIARISTAYSFLTFLTDGTERMRINGLGNVGIGNPLPTAVLHLKAGTASANTAPLKFASGTNLTTPEAGAIEWNGTNLFLTNSGATRQTINQGLTGSATLDFGSTNAQSSADLTITVTGASDGDVVSLGVPNGSVNANSSYSAWVSAANTVTVRFNNYSSGSVDPASGTFKVFVTKF